MVRRFLLMQVMALRAFADGSTTTARFDEPRGGMAVAADGRVFVADEVNQSDSRD